MATALIRTWRTCWISVSSRASAPRSTSRRRSSGALTMSSRSCARSTRIVPITRRWSAARATTCQQDRAGGAYYQATWDGALASSPSWAVVVSTFNEWMESTQIEPSQQWGDQYLQATKQNADLFKASMGG